MASQDSTIGAYTIYLNMFALQNAKEVDKFEASICEMLPSSPPKMVVFVGNASFVFCDNLNKIWPDIPMLLCGERDYTGPDSLIIQAHALAPQQRIPISDLQKTMNLTMLYANLYIEENLQLMKQLIPQMNKVIYIGDGTYTCQQNDYDLSATIRKKHPTWNISLFLQKTPLPTVFSPFSANRILSLPDFCFLPGYEKKTMKKIL